MQNWLIGQQIKKAQELAAAQARGQWIEQQEAAEAAFVQEMQAEQKRRNAEAQARQQAFDMARWKQEDFAEGARWEAQQAYQRYRQGERADPQPKSLWQRVGEWVRQNVVQPVQQAVPRVMNWIDRHQTQIAIGLGIAVGVAAIVLSGGAATPLVAAAWVAGSAEVAGGVAALGTVGLNAYFHRPLGTNVLRNLGYAAGAAAVTATAGFALQAVAPTLTRATAQFCLSHVTTCTVAAPAFKAVDYGWTAYDVWQSQRVLNNPRASTSEKLLAAANIGLAAWSESLEPDDLLAFGLPADDVARLEILAQFRKVLAEEGEEAALKYLQRVAGDVPLAKLLGAVDEDVLEYAAKSGPDAVKALAGWDEAELAAHQVELALRAERDARAIKATEELVQLGPIDPAHLTRRQEALLDDIARNSMQYAENGQVVIGAWRNLDDGYVGYAMETGSAYYHNHQAVWDTLKSELGGEGAAQAAWLINQKALQPYIERGMPFEYTLKGVEDLDIERQVVDLIWQGKSDVEILRILPRDMGFKTRWRELIELYEAGYQKTFDEIANTYILVWP